MRTRITCVLCIVSVTLCCMGLVGCGTPSEQPKQYEEGTVEKAWYDSSEDAICVVRVLDKKSKNIYNAPVHQGVEMSVGLKTKAKIHWHNDEECCLMLSDGKEVPMWEDHSTKDFDISWHNLDEYNERGVLLKDAEAAEGGNTPDASD